MKSKLSKQLFYLKNCYWIEGSWVNCPLLIFWCNKWVTRMRYKLDKSTRQIYQYSKPVYSEFLGLLDLFIYCYFNETRSYKMTYRIFLLNVKYNKRTCLNINWCYTFLFAKKFVFRLTVIKLCKHLQYGKSLTCSVETLFT